MDVPGLLTSNYLFSMNWIKSISQIVLTKSPFWIKMYNIPLYRMDKENAMAIRNRIGEFLDVDMKSDGVG